MYLGDIAHSKGSQHRAQGKHRRQRLPPFAHAPADVIHGAAQVCAVCTADPVSHGQHHLGILGRHAEKRRNPHPEHRSGAAQGDGPGHSGDIARTDRSGQCRAHRLKRGPAPAPKAPAHLPDGGPQLPHLHGPGLPGQQHSHGQQQHHGRRPPDQLRQLLHGHPSLGIFYAACRPFLSCLPEILCGS